MNIKLTQHAKKRISERGISEKDIYLAITNPDKLQNSIKSTTRFIAKKLVHLKQTKHVLLVIFERNGKEVLVITVIDTSKIDKYY